MPRKAPRTDNEDNTTMSRSSSRQYFQPVGFLGTVGRAWTVGSKRWGGLLLVHGTAVLCYYILSAMASYLIAKVLLYWLEDSFSNSSNFYDESYGYQQNNNVSAMEWDEFFDDPNLWITVAVYFLIYYIILSVAEGASIWMISELYGYGDNRSAGADDDDSFTKRFSRACRAAFAKTVPLLKACLVTTFLVYIPSIAVIWMSIRSIRQGDGSSNDEATLVLMLLYFIYQVIALSFASQVYPIIMIESSGGGGVLEHLKRSFNLTLSHFFHVAAVLGTFQGVKVLCNIAMTSLFPGQQHNKFHITNGNINADVDFGCYGDGFLSILLTIVFGVIWSL